MLDLQRLRSFVAVARHQHVGRAARELHISQSPLSRQIIALEAELGVLLFTREKKRLQLTEHGRLLMSDAERLLESASALERRAQSLASGAEGRLVIGYVEAAVYSGVLPADLKRLQRRAPAALIELRTLRSAEQVAALQSGAIDLGYAHTGAPHGSGLSSRLLLHEPFMLVVQKANKQTFAQRIAHLQQQRFITLPESLSPRARDELLAACARIGLRPEVTVEASDPAVVLALVAAGLGYAIVQASLRSVAPAGVQLLRMPARFGLRLEVHQLTRTAPSPLARLLTSAP
jgi:DNA-binding transcriptional LysR family regulator